VLADPPYDVVAEEVGDVLALLRDQGWLAPGSLVVVERATRGGDVVWPQGYAAVAQRRYGETTLWYGRPAP
jgi:16S rRNA (guanine966-N2)-methyltransferase